MTTVIVCGMQCEADTIKHLGLPIIVSGGDGQKIVDEMKMYISSGTATSFLSFGLAGSLKHYVKVGDVVSGLWVREKLKEEFYADIFTDHVLEYKIYKRLKKKFYIISGDIKGDEELFLKKDNTSTSTAVDMESVFVARTAFEHKIPFNIVRVISDMTDLPPVSFVAIRKDGSIDVKAIINSLYNNPKQIFSFIKLCYTGTKSLRKLRKVAKLLEGVI